jgi:hypothetical protein
VRVAFAPPEAPGVFESLDSAEFPPLLQLQRLQHSATVETSTDEEILRGACWRMLWLLRVREQSWGAPFHNRQRR